MAPSSKPTAKSTRLSHSNSSATPPVGAAPSPAHCLHNKLTGATATTLMMAPSDPSPRAPAAAALFVDLGQSTGGCQGGRRPSGPARSSWCCWCCRCPPATKGGSAPCNCGLYGVACTAGCSCGEGMGLARLCGCGAAEVWGRRGGAAGSPGGAMPVCAGAGVPQARSACLRSQMWTEPDSQPARVCSPSVEMLLWRWGLGSVCVRRVCW